MKLSSAYIHIPFCNQICSYCDFPKMLYQKKWINDYLNSLEQEINTNYKGEILNTIYIGGGTPSSLDNTELKHLFNIINKLKKNDNIEYTIECNIDSLTKEKIEIFKENKINRISIGIETFNEKYLKTLNRNNNYEETKELIYYLKENGFNNINIDLMYAIKNQTIEELNNDLEKILSLDICHISTYSLILEPNTMLYLKEKYIDEDLDCDMYKKICTTLKKYNYIHYETSNFCKIGYESKHNLTYWNNEEYYGFGLGASGYVKNTRYTNTKSITNYINSIKRIEEETLTQKEKMENEMILGFRKIKGINTKKFKKKYNKEVEEIFDIKSLLNERKLIKEKDYLKINEDYLYLSNDILINFIGD